MTIEELSRNGSDGSRSTGQHRKVTASSGTTVVLTAADSGGVFLLDRATVTYTLPATPVVGMTYTFMSTISGASGSQQVNASATSGAIFLLGSIQMAEEDQTDGKCFLADGVADVGIDLTSAATGADIGSSFTVTCLTSTIWNITGILNGTGAHTTPFTT